jgi:hypothetical protein
MLIRTQICTLNTIPQLKELLQLVQTSKIAKEDKLLAMQKLKKATSNAIVTHRAT